MIQKVTIHITNRMTNDSILIKGTVEAKRRSEDMDDHDLAAYLFAIEFAANNQSNLPMRVHIKTQD